MNFSNHLADRASDLEQQQRDDALDVVRRQLAVQGTAECVDCGEPIPAERRQLMPCSTRCVPCQNLHEYRGRQREGSFK